MKQKLQDTRVFCRQMGAIIQLFYFKTFLNILILVMTEVNNNSITVQSCVCGAHFLILA